MQKLCLFLEEDSVNEIESIIVEFVTVKICLHTTIRKILFVLVSELK